MEDSNLQILFSSAVSVTTYRKDTLKRYNKRFPKKFDDPDRPNLYRESLSGAVPLSMCTSLLDSSDYVHFTPPHNNYKYLELCQEYCLNPCVQTATTFINGYSQKRGYKRRRDNHTTNEKGLVESCKSQNQKVYKSGGGVPKDLPLPENVMGAIIYSDLLHDIGHEYRKWVFSHIDNTIMSYDNVQRKNITWTVYKEWLRIGNINESDFIGGYENVMSNWKKILQTDGEELTICLDGFLNNLQSNSNRNLFEDTCLESGLLLLLLHRSGKTFKKLTLVDGLFNEIDNFYLVDYIHKYISALSIIMKGVVVVATQVQPVSPKYIPFDILTLGSSSIQLKNGAIIPISDRQNAWHIWDVNALQTFHVPYSKRDLTALFAKNKNSTDHDVQQVLCNAAEVNFFRDAYRIDLAIQNNWSYITHDRLAFVFYNILVTILGVQNRSIFVAKTTTQNALDTMQIQCLTHV